MSTKFEGTSKDKSIFSILKLDSKYRSKKDLKKIKEVLLSSVPFCLNFENVCENLKDKILDTMSENLFYEEMEKGKILFNRSQNQMYYIVLEGELIELGVKYEKIFLTKEQYICFLNKLHQLDDLFLFEETLNLNESIIPKCLLPIFETTTFNLKRSLKPINSFSDYQKIIMPVIQNLQREINGNNKMQFILPSYYAIKKIKEGDVIGNVCLSKTNSFYGYFVESSSVKFAVLDKSNKACKYINQYIKSIVKERIKEIFDSFYLFKGMDKDYFAEKYSKYFQYQKVKKGEEIIKQNILNSKVYFVKSGEFEVKCHSEVANLYKIISDFKQCLDTFPENISALNSIDDNSFNFQKFILHPLYKTKEFIHNSRITQDFVFKNIKNRQIIGLNEYYGKRHVSHFSVTCLKDGEVLAINLDNFISLMKGEPDLMKKCITLTENAIKSYLTKITHIKNCVMYTTEKNIVNKPKYYIMKKKDQVYFKNLKQLYISSSPQKQRSRMNTISTLDTLQTQTFSTNYFQTESES